MIPAIPKSPESRVLWECTACLCINDMRPVAHVCLGCGHRSVDHQRTVNPPTWEEGYLAGFVAAETQPKKGKT